MSAKRRSRKISGADLPEVRSWRNRSQKRHWSCWDASTSWGKLEKERDRARMFQGREPSKAEGGFAVATDSSSFCSCSPSLAHHVKQCAQPSGSPPSMGRKEIRGALTWKVKWRSWR